MYELCVVFSETQWLFGKFGANDTLHTMASWSQWLVGHIEKLDTMTMVILAQLQVGHNDKLDKMTSWTQWWVRHNDYVESSNK